VSDASAVLDGSVVSLSLPVVDSVVSVGAGDAWLALLCVLVVVGSMVGCDGWFGAVRCGSFAGGLGRV
jgi:hypothetical protein